ncbi:outer membrane lipoprotein-sorting protein [candidate division WOR-3 bacterium]|nr:outer membrane lipoprotein-sorting protein [candidate division WOR-3 bacterium]
MRSIVQSPWSVWLLSFSLSLGTALPDGNAILKRIDDNVGADNRVVVAEMVITGRRGTRTIRTKSWISDTEKSFTEYLAPERERGTKMLNLGRQLWTYSPDSDRTIMISGHVLRQSVSGSDLSYEDLMEDPRLVNRYTAQTIGTDTVIGRPVWKLELTARTADVAYQQAKLWVDQERSIVLKEERYSRGGRLLKTTEVREVRQFDSRWLARSAVFRDVLKAGGGTELRLDSVWFNVNIPDSRFSKAALKK